MAAELPTLAESWLAFDSSLRENRGLDGAALSALRAALAECATAWADRDSIPKLGASILVDIFPATEANAHLYPGATGERIAEIAYELHELVSGCVQ